MLSEDEKPLTALSPLRTVPRLDGGLDGGRLPSGWAASSSQEQSHTKDVPITTWLRNHLREFRGQESTMGVKLMPGISPGRYNFCQGECMHGFSAVCKELNDRHLNRWVVEIQNGIWWITMSPDDDELFEGWLKIIEEIPHFECLLPYKPLSAELQRLCGVESAQQVDSSNKHSVKVDSSNKHSVK